jgi:hypothetical protein
MGSNSDTAVLTTITKFMQLFGQVARVLCVCLFKGGCHETKVQPQLHHDVRRVERLQ